MHDHWCVGCKRCSLLYMPNLRGEFCIGNGGLGVVEIRVGKFGSGRVLRDCLCLLWLVCVCVPNVQIVGGF